MEYLGAWGTLIHEKNLKSKISCQTPFNAQIAFRNFFKYASSLFANQQIFHQRTERMKHLF